MQAFQQNRIFLASVVVLLAVMAWMMVVSVRDESQTWDEAIHISAGYSYWKTGDYRLNTEHPPLAKLLVAIPLLWMDLRFPAEHPSWAVADEVEFGRQFLYHNTVPADIILFRARQMMIGLTLLFGACFAFWARRIFGVLVALTALALFCFEPTIIAHGRYATTDLAIAFFSFLAVTAWFSWLKHGGWVRLLWAGTALGLAMASKFSWPFLLPVFILAAIIVRAKPLRAASGIAVAIITGCAVVAVAYAPVAHQLIPATRSYRAAHPEVKFLGADLALNEIQSGFSKFAITLAPKLGLQPHPYLMGLLRGASDNQAGHDSYLLGMVSEQGWWYYFPVAFLVKEPTGLLLGILAALVVGVALGWRGENSRMLWLALGTIVIYLAIVISVHINIGIRHLLPILPFVHILVAGVLWPRWRIALGVFELLVVAETSLQHPYYLPFFNMLVGGPANGSKYLVDSNLDWGQDFKRLKAWAVAHQGESDLC